MIWEYGDCTTKKNGTVGANYLSCVFFFFFFVLLAGALKGVRLRNIRYWRIFIAHSESKGVRGRQSLYARFSKVVVNNTPGKRKSDRSLEKTSQLTVGIPLEVLMIAN